MHWVQSCVLAVVFFVIGTLCIRYVSEQDLPFISKYGAIVLALSMGIVALGFYAIQSFRVTKSDTVIKTINSKTVRRAAYLAFAGLCFFFAYWFYIHGIAHTPNASYARAIMNLEIVLLALASWFLFGHRISVQAFLGFLVMAIGIVLVARSS